MRPARKAVARLEIRCLMTNSQTVDLGPDQTCYELPLCYEIWEGDPPSRRVWRVPRGNVTRFG